MDKLIEIIHRTSNQLVDIDDEHQIYQIMNDGVREILPGVYFVITKLQPDDMNFRIMHSFGFDKYMSAIKSLLGKDPFQMDFPFNDLDDAKKEIFENRKLHHFIDGIYDLVNGKINKTICKTIEKILGIADVCAISFCVGKKYFGGASLFIPNSTIKSGGLSEDTVYAIETLAYQASFAINRLRDIEALKKKEDELMVSQSRFNQLVNQLNDIVWKANGDGTEIIDLNNSFEKYYGITSAEFVKNPNLWFEVVHPEDREIAQRASSELFNNGNAECEYRIVKPDGTIIWLHDRKSMIFDTDGKPIQMGGVASDITEKKLLEEKLILKDYALDNSPIAIGLADFNGILFYTNDAYIRLLDYENKIEVIGKHIFEFADFPENTEVVIKMLKEGKTYTGEIKPKRKDGTTIDCLITAKTIINNHTPICNIALFVDITERKVLETKLRENEAKLSKLNKEKDRFFSIIAHDLKSPFNGMLGLLDILVNNYYGYSDDERLKLIQASHNSAQKAFELLTDLLKWAGLQNRRFEIKKESVNLKDVIDENIELYKKNALEKEISIENNIVQSINITVDINSINTVVRNLMINAIKFTLLTD